MPAGTDRPGADSPADSGRPRGSSDNLRRRLANLPPSHPSSPWYREPRRPAPETPPGERQGTPAGERPDRRAEAREAGERPDRRDRAARTEEPEGPGQAWRGRPGESGGVRSGESGRSRPGESGDVRSEGSRVNRGEREGQSWRRAAERGASADVTGGPAAAAARAAGSQASGGEGRASAKDRRAADDELWAQAARQHAAAKARREGRGTGAPAAPGASREPYRPWFADSAADELWLSAEGTGEPWFAEGSAERPQRDDLP